MHPDYELHTFFFDDVVRLCDEGYIHLQIADQTRLGKSTVGRYLQIHRRQQRQRAEQVKTKIVREDGWLVAA